jgi:hypothetical protein
MITISESARSIILRRTEIFLLNQSDNTIGVDGDEIGSPLTIWPGHRASREVSRGTTVIIATRILGRYNFELSVNELGRSPIERCEFMIPSEAGNSLYWGWDGRAWHRLGSEEIHGFNGDLRRLRHPVWA